MKHLLLMMILAVFTPTARSQTTTALTLEECYRLAKAHYPAVQQLELVQRTTDYSLANASRGYLPQLSVNGQASYQSEVTRIPISIPNMTVPELSKDQYKLYAEVSQAVYDGGAIGQQKKILEANRAAESQKVEVELYKLRERICQLYFGVLLIDAQLKQTDILRSDLALGITKTEAAIANGTALKSTLSVLKAEVLKTEQRVTELRALRTAYTDMLALFTGLTIGESTLFTLPEHKAASTDIQRPELALYSFQQQSIDASSGLLTAKNRPRLNAFVQAGYGRPALNMLSNDFEPYAIGGLRLTWSITGFYTLKNDRALLEINRSAIAVQRETFLLNTQITLRQQHAEVAKLQELLQTDDEIIALRETVKTTSAAQLENGVINTNDYLRDVNAEDQARQTKLLHELHLLQAQYNQLITTGN
jgi:outer membrane protein TolC